MGQAEADLRTVHAMEYHHRLTSDDRRLDEEICAEVEKNQALIGNRLAYSVLSCNYKQSTFREQVLLPSSDLTDSSCRGSTKPSNSREIQSLRSIIRLKSMLLTMSLNMYKSFHSKFVTHPNPCCWSHIPQAILNVN